MRKGAANSRSMACDGLMGIHKEEDLEDKQLIAVVMELSRIQGEVATEKKCKYNRARDEAIRRGGFPLLA
jgi:hypothetical protein